MRVFITLILTLFVFSTASNGFQVHPDEGLTSNSRRARRAYQRAEDAWRLYEKSVAVAELKQALRHDPEFIEAHLLLAEIHYQNNEFALSIKPLKTAISIDEDFFPMARYYLARSCFYTASYNEALKSFEKIVDDEKLSARYVTSSKRYIESARFALHAMENPVPYDPQNPGPAINSEYAEYSPALTADEQTLIFTRRKPLKGHWSGRDDYYREDFYISHFQDGRWQEAVNPGPPLNSDGNEGAQTITADGRHMYFTACNRPEGVGRCDIYYAERIGGKWTKPSNMGRPVNSTAWDSQPSVSTDGQTLYFASSRSGNVGNTDIWKTTMDGDGVWTEPVNLGSVINTPGRELSPFIHPDNNTLYFASDGHPGMGGLDIFVSRRQEDGSWGEPFNLGYPVNTHRDEFALIVGASGERAWFASEKEGGFGESDLYFFELYPEVRPNPVSYMRGVVFDAQTEDPLMAYFELTELESGTRIARAASDPLDGTFLVAVPKGKDLGLHVVKENYLFFSEYFNYGEARTAIEPYERNIPLQPIEEGSRVVLRNLFFDTDSYTLKPASMPELQRLRDLLLKNPGLQIEIGGHTDSTGTFVYNLRLSEKRAQSVYEYLTEEGVSSERLHFKGYADTQPVDTNQTEEGRANNRRTEFRVLNNNQRDR